MLLTFGWYDMQENRRPGVYKFRSTMYYGTFRNIVNREMFWIFWLKISSYMLHRPLNTPLLISIFSHQYLEWILRKAIQQFSYNEFRKYGIQLILEVRTGQTVSPILSSAIVFSTQNFLVVYNTDRTELLKRSAKQTLFHSPLLHRQSLKVLPNSLWNDFARV